MAVGEVVGRRVLEHVRLGAALERAPGGGDVVFHRQHHDAGAGLAQVGHHVEAGARAELDVEHDHIGRQAARQAHRLAGLAAGADHLEVGVVAEQAGDAGAHDRVVIDEQYPNHPAPRYTARLRKCRTGDR